MKRIGNIFDETISIENLRAGHYDARKGKMKRRGRDIEKFEADFEKNLFDLHESLLNGTYRIHPYRRIVRVEAGKRREIDYSPCWTDQIVQRAIGRTLGEKLMASLIDDTFAGIKGRGIHRGVRRIKRHLARHYTDDMPIYVYKIDIRHYYQSVDHDVLKKSISAKVKDKRLLALLGMFIDSVPNGIPIGNYISPIFANFLLSPIDHWAKETFRVTGYYRYLDDIVAIDSSKEKMRMFQSALKEKMLDLKLEIKGNEQLFPIERYGIDFIGYVFRRHVVRVRKRVERAFRKTALKYTKTKSAGSLRSLASYWGWLKGATGGMNLWYQCFAVNYKKLLKGA